MNFFSETPNLVGEALSTGLSDGFKQLAHNKMQELQERHAKREKRDEESRFNKLIEKRDWVGALSTSSPDNRTKLLGNPEFMSALLQGSGLPVRPGRSANHAVERRALTREEHHHEYRPEKMGGGPRGRAAKKRNPRFL